MSLRMMVRLMTTMRLSTTVVENHDSSLLPGEWHLAGRLYGGVCRYALFLRIYIPSSG